MMKKITSFLILLLVAGVYSYGQKKSGTVYSEHEAIETTRALWKAFVAGDADTYRSFFADSAYLMNHGQRSDKVANPEIGKWIPDWVGNYENLKVMDDKPATPDALVYKEGQTWTQDWLRMWGIHKETGIVVDLPLHNLYAFDDKGKVTVMITYFNNNIFEEITASKGKKENGKVYINHPYIASVRKLVNAFVAQDWEKMRTFYSEKAVYASTTMEYGKTISMEDHIAYLKKTYTDLKYRVERVGYPDCIYYEKNDLYAVYSWWKMTVKKEDKPVVISFMVTHNFDKEGKISAELMYISSNNLDKL